MYTQRNLRLVTDILTSSHTPDKIENLLLLLENQQAHQLLQVVETTKINLTEHEQVKSFFDNLGTCLTFDVSLKTFNEAVRQECEKIVRSMKECLSLAGLKADRVDLLILTGGTTQIPLVQQSIRRLFPQAIISSGQRMESVALGLGYMAQKVFA